MSFNLSKKDKFHREQKFQNEVPPSRINIKLDLHTGGAQKKVELPLKLLVTGDYSNGQDKRDLAEKEKVNINKNNFWFSIIRFQS